MNVPQYSEWATKAESFIDSLSNENGLYPSVPKGRVTLYGTCYAINAKYFLGCDVGPSGEVVKFLMDCQNSGSGLLIGPELDGFAPQIGAQHDYEHLSLHLTCAALSTCQQFGVSLRYSILEAKRYCDLNFLKSWLENRSLVNAWFEGNNFLFVGQLLVYLRDIENYSEAQPALDMWFDWLDRNVDPVTSLWGTNGFCSASAAVYGGYHQLLVYYYENRPLMNSKGLVDTVLSLQHEDGGFNPDGNGGACEDVDSVDILVNLYKRVDYRRAEIRFALTRCVDHILSTQNEDGGFPYNLNRPQSHMGIPGTQAAENVSTTFPTWFRIHTLALCAEIIPEHPALRGVPFRFNQTLCMGWHKSPLGWKLDISEAQRTEEKKIASVFIRQKRIAALYGKLATFRHFASRARNKARRRAGSIKRKILG